MNTLRYLKFVVLEAIHLARRDFIGIPFKRHNGKAIEICNKIVRERWNGEYFDTGSTIFNGEFWTRDFSLCLDGLIYLGYKNEVEKTLIWALERFNSNGQITTTISREGDAVDIFSYSADSLPFILADIIKTKRFDLADTYKNLLNNEIARYYENVYDPLTKIVKDNPLSSPKDVVIRNKTCVANSFMIYLSDMLNTNFPNLNNPFKGVDLRSSFVKSFWDDQNGYFKNDLMDEKNNVISADANIIPFLLNVVTDKKMLQNSLKSIKREKLDDPFPLKYHSFYNEEWMNMNLSTSIFSPNYQGNSIWTMLAPLYIELESKYYPEDAKKHMIIYLNLIRKYRTYIEVYEPDGRKPLAGRFGHHAETGMLWSAMIPLMISRIQNNKKI